MAQNRLLKIGTYTIEVTNADKVLFPDDGLTKGDLIDYYHRIARYMLPHIKDRPLTLQRFPNGIGEEGFFQKSAGDYFPDWVKRARMKKSNGTTNYVICNHAATLVYLAEQDTITHHIWLSRADQPQNPDLMVFDLDPSDEDFAPVRRAAFSLRDLLTELGLSVFVKSTGSRGLHVTVPLDRSADFDAVRTFAEKIARVMVSRDPERLTVEQRKEKRGNRVFIDTLRNSYNQTAVAPYTIRARRGAPVAFPLDWEELKDPRLTPQAYNITNIFKRLEARGDPWDKIYRNAKTLDEAAWRLDKLKQ